MENKNLYLLVGVGLGALALYGLYSSAEKKPVKKETPKSEPKPEEKPSTEATTGITSAKSGRYIETGIDGKKRNNIAYFPVEYTDYGVNGFYYSNPKVEQFYGVHGRRPLKRVYANQALRSIPPRKLAEGKSWCCTNRDSNNNCTSWEQRPIGSPCDSSARQIPPRKLAEGKMWCCSDRDAQGNCTNWEQRPVGSPCDNNA